MTEFFKEWNPSIRSQQLVFHINEILEEYREMGYILTLRQLYYQLVSRDIIMNSVKEYGKIGNVVSNGRMAGLIDWNMIEDRTRTPQQNSHWDDPAEILRAAAQGYYRSRWEKQNIYVEVWCEKDAVSNIILPVCRRFDVAFMANKGYSSQSAMYEASKRLASSIEEGTPVSIIYVGDHDPSGIDMTRDIDDRLGLFVFGEGNLGTVDRVALNMDQVEEYNPPRNPAKVTDTRFQIYEVTYGTSSWELDALEPKVLESIIEKAIKQHIDEEAWEEVEILEKEHKDKLQKIADNFEDVTFEE
jgi:hypothetical protein